MKEYLYFYTKCSFSFKYLVGTLPDLLTTAKEHV